MPPNYGYNQDPVGRLQQYSQQNYQKALGQMSIMDLQRMRGSRTDLYTRAMGGMSDFLSGEKTGGGFGRTPAFMQASTFQGRITGAVERRQEYYRSLYGPNGPGALNQIGRDVFGSLGMGSVYDNPYIRKSLNAIGKITGTNLVSDTRDSRDRIRTAMQLQPVMDRMMGSNRMLEDSRFGFQSKASDSFKMASLIGDPEKLRSIISKSQLDKYKDLVGREKTFTRGEAAQFMAQNMREGEFTGLSTGLGGIKDRETRKEVYMKRVAAANLKAMQGVKDSQKIFGMEKPEDAQRLNRILAAGGRAGDLKDSDKIKIRNIQKRVGLSMEALEQVLEMGNNIAKQIGVTKIQGQSMALRNVSDVQALTQSGGVSMGTIQAFGGKKELGQALLQMKSGRAASHQGKLHRTALAMLDRIGGKDPKRAAAMRRQLDAEIGSTGRVSRDTVAQFARDAGYGDTEAQDINEFMDRNEAMIATRTKNQNAEGQFFVSRAKEFRKQFEAEGVPQKQIQSRIQRRLKREMLKYGMDAKSAARMATSLSNPEGLRQWDKVTKRTSESAGRRRASEIVAELNQGDYGDDDWDAIFKRRTKGLDLSEEEISALKEMKGKDFKDSGRIFKKVTDDLSPKEETSTGAYAAGILGGAATFGLLGAKIGSIFGPVGTAVGGAIGAIGGGIFGGLKASDIQASGAFGQKKKKLSRAKWEQDRYDKMAESIKDKIPEHLREEFEAAERGDLNDIPDDLKPYMAELEKARGGAKILADRRFGKKEKATRRVSGGSSGSSEMSEVFREASREGARGIENRQDKTNRLLNRVATAVERDRENKY